MKFLSDILAKAGLIVDGATTLNGAVAATIDTDKFMVLDGSLVKYRSGSQVLSDIGAQAALTNPVTGTGTSGQVSYWNGTNSQSGNDNLFWDVSNNRLGIGTTTPSGALNVKGSITNDTNANGSGAFYNEIRKSRGTATSPTNIIAGDDIGGYIAYGYEGGVYRSGAALAFNAESVSSGSVAMRIRFFTGAGAPTLATERMRITAAGNVLIGLTTDNLVNKVQIGGSVLATSFVMSGGTYLQYLMADGSVSTLPNIANWNTAYNDSIVSAEVTGTTTKTLTLTQQDGGTLTTSWTDINTDAVTSVFGRTGAVVAVTGDYTTTQVTEGTNLYYTEGRVSANTDVAANTAARHNAVTIGTANGLSLSAQILSLDLASTIATGALSSTDWTTFNGKFSLPSLTSGSVLFSNGTTIAEDNTNFYWDDVNNRLGIGNNIPTAPLDFGSGTGTAGTINKIALYASIYGNYGLGISPNQLDYVSANSHVFYNNSSSLTELFRIDSVGNLTSASLVGTGTRMVVTSSTGVLSSQAITTGTVTSIATTGPITGGTITSTGTIGITQATSTTDGYLSSADWTTFNAKIGGSGTTNYLPKFTGTSAIGNSLVFDNGTNVGISTTSPLAKLHVSGVVLSDFSNFGFYTAKNNNHLTQNAYFDGAWKSYGSSATFGSAILFQTAGQSNTALEVLVDNSISAANEALTFVSLLKIFTSGNFSLGNIVDSGFKFDVSGTARVQTSILVGTSGNAIPNATQVARFVSNTTGSDVEINGNGYARLFFNDYSRGTDLKYYEMLNLSSDFKISRLNDANNLRTERLTIFGSTGNVFIGSSPSDATAAKLFVNGTGRYADNLTVSKNQNAGTTITVSNTTSGTSAGVYIGLTSDATSGSSSFGKYSTTNNATKIISATDAYIYNGATAGDIAILNDFATGKIKFAAGASSTAQMTLTQNGRLLLGTTTEATFLLDVNGTTRMQDNLLVSKNQNATTELGISNTTNLSGSAVQLLFTSDTLSGVSAFGKFSTSRSATKIISPKDSFWYNATGGDISILNDVAVGKIKFAAGGSSTAQMTLTSAGRLLLGTTTDNGTDQLQVTGTIRTTSTANIGGSLNVTGVTTLSDIAAIGTAVTQNNLNINRAITGAVTANGVQVSSQVGGTVTTAARYFSAIASTAAGTLTDLFNFRAAQGTLTGTVTNQYGYFVDATLIGATNNFAFRGAIPNAANRWNLYMDGTADNYLAGKLGIGTTTPSGQLHIRTVYPQIILETTSGTSLAELNLSVNPLSGANLYFRQYNGSATGTFLGFANGNSSQIVQNDATALLIGTVKSVPLIFGTNNTERARITGAGRLLLGTTTEATFLLDVNGTARFQDNLTVSRNVNLGTNIFISNTLSGTGAGVYLGLTSDAGSGTASFGKQSTTNNVNKILSPKDAYIYNGTGGDIALLNDVAAGKIKFAAGASSTAQMTLTSAGSLLIGGTTEYASAITSIDSTTKGFLPPRMTTTEKNAIATPAAGLVVYDTTLGSTSVYDGSTWINDTITTNRQAASYSLVLTDRGKLVEMNVATANNLTVPLNSSIAFPIGTKIDLSQYGAGQTTVVATGGVTIRSAGGALKLAVQYSGASLVKIGTDEWYLFGDITV